MSARDDPHFVIEVAADLTSMFADFAGRDEETSAGPITVFSLSPGGYEERVTDHPANWDGAMLRAWQQAMVHAPPDSDSLPIECRVDFADWYNTGKSSVSGFLHRVHDTGAVRFALNGDFSDAVRVGEIPWPTQHQGPLDGLDSGVLLLEPITLRELAGIEPILSELWRAVDEGSLTEAQRHQIIAMAELIRAERQATTPDETERWKLIGTIRAALRYLAKEAPKDALAWWKLIELLQKIDWPNVAHHLPPL